MKKFNLLVPMAGRGSRFIKKGYKVPKQLIYVEDKQLLDLSLECVDISDCNLIFVVRDDQVSNFKFDKILKKKFGNDIQIVTVDHVTDGSVCSCLLAREHIDNDMPLIIHTLDVQFFPIISPASIFTKDLDGTIFTFKSNSPNYSYVEVDENNLATKTAEKKVISENACVGIYCFSKGSEFCKYADEMISRDTRTNNEFYITPLYNLLIQDDCKICIKEVEKMHIFGTPSEFEFYKSNVIKKFGKKPVALCSDHSGYECKEKFKSVLEKMSIKYIDFGTHVTDDCDYKYFIDQAIMGTKDSTCDFVFGFCRTGQGVNICANKHKGIRSALIYDEFSAEMAVRHNCANFFAFPSRLFESKNDLQNIENLISIFLNNTFDGGRFQVRIQGLENEDL